MKLWIARDRAIIPDDMEHFIERHPEKEIEFAKLHIFYDTPKWNGKAWSCAREMCEVKNYMFPEIEMGKCVEFNSKLKNKLSFEEMEELIDDLI